MDWLLIIIMIAVGYARLLVIFVENVYVLDVHLG